MRHKVGLRKLGRDSGHRSALLRNQATDLFRYERIRTTEPKAKEVQSLAEKLITLELTIDTGISQVMEYFEIFMTRMLASRKAAKFLGTTFGLTVNGNRLT